MRTMRIGILLAPFMLAAFSAFAQGTWTAYTNGNYINSVAVQGNYVWCGTSGGVVRWDKRDMSHVKFTTHDGLRDNTVQKVAVSPDGTVWACSFDGVSFLRDGKWNVLSLPGDNTITGLTGIAFVPDGEVWIVFKGVVYQYKNSALTTFSPEETKKYATAQAIAVGPDSTVWVGTQRGLFHYRDGVWEAVDGEYRIIDMRVAPDGAVWCNTELKGFVRYHNGEWKHFASDEGLLIGNIDALEIDSNGAVWVSGVNFPGIGSGPVNGSIYMFNGSTWEEVAFYEGDSIVRYCSPAFDPDGTLWFGSSHEGLWRMDGSQWTNYLTEDRITGSTVITSLAIERNGAVWMGMYQRINRFNGFSWETYDLRGATIPYNWDTFIPTYRPVGSIAVTPGGDIWLVSDTAVLFRQGTTWKIFNHDTGFPEIAVQSVAVRSEQDIWFGAGTGIVRYDGSSWKTISATESGDLLAGPVTVGSSGEVWARALGKGAARFAGDHWTVFSMNEGFSDSVIKFISAGKDGAVWFSTPRGLSRYDGARWTSYSEKDGLPRDAAMCMAVGPDGAVWLGTLNSGVFRFDGKTWLAHTTTDGLADNRVESIAFAPDGAIWFGTASGLSRYLPDLSSAVSEKEIYPPQFAIIGSFPNPFNPSTTISFTMTRSGSAELAVYSMTGQKVRTLVSGPFSNGTHTVVWDGYDYSGKPVSSGVYLSRLTAGKQTATGKMLLMK